MSKQSATPDERAEVVRFLKMMRPMDEAANVIIKRAIALLDAPISEQQQIDPRSVVPKKVLRDLINQMNSRSWDIHTTAHLAICLQSLGYDLNKDGTEVGAQPAERNST